MSTFQLLDCTTIWACKLPEAALADIQQCWVQVLEFLPMSYILLLEILRRPPTKPGRICASLPYI